MLQLKHARPRSTPAPASRQLHKACCRALEHQHGSSSAAPGQGNRSAARKPLNFVVETNVQPVLLPLRDLGNSAALLGEAFGGARSPLQRLVHGCCLVGTILCTMTQAGRNAGCMLAFVSQAAGSGAGQQLAGMATVHMISLQDGAGHMAAAMQLTPGTAVALIANLAVRAEVRGRGIGRSMLGAVEELAGRRFRPRPAALMLLVDRDNIPAVALYRSAGFEECPEWVDPAWLEDAHKGRLGSPRRLLFLKRLPAAA